MHIRRDACQLFQLNLWQMRVSLVLGGTCSRGRREVAHYSGPPPPDQTGWSAITHLASNPRRAAPEVTQTGDASGSAASDLSSENSPKGKAGATFGNGAPSD